MKDLKRTPAMLFAAALLLFGTACGGNSEAARIVEADNTSLRATISHYQALDPTMTAQAAVWTQQIATLQADLNQAREQVTRLTVQMNTGVTGGTGAPVAVLPTTDPNNFASVATLPPAPPPPPIPESGTPIFSGQGAPAASQPLRSPSGMIIERVVTARGMNNADGCPVNETNAFTTTDGQVWAIAVVRNYKRGTTFATQWQGGADLNETYDWTVNANGAQICVHFYYETATLPPGNYTVTFSARETDGTLTTSAPIPFVVR